MSGLTVGELTGNSKKWRESWPRAQMYLEAFRAGFTIREIAAYYGRDKTTISEMKSKAEHREQMCREHLQDDQSRWTRSDLSPWLQLLERLGSEEVLGVETC